MPQLAARAVTRKTEAAARVCVGVGRDGASSRLYVAPQPARQHPHRMQPSYDVFHRLGAAHGALWGSALLCGLDFQVAQNRDASSPRPRGPPWPPHTPATSGLAFMFSVQPPVPAGRTRVGAFPTGNAGNGGFAAAHQRAPVPRAQPFRRPDSELDMYRREPAVSLADYDFDLLDYWKVKSKIYPHLGKMARQYLACPASSANVERLFSPVTAMHSDLRKSTLERTFQRTIRVRMEGRP